MSKCSHCLQGFCRRHPLQDHGERAAQLKEKVQGTSQSAIGSLIQAQIEKLQAQAKGTGMDDSMWHRSLLDEERQKLLANSKSKSSSKANGDLPSSGLNPSVASIMQKNYSDGSDSESDSSDSDSSGSDDSSDSSHRKKKRKHSSKSSKSKKDRKKHKKSGDRKEEKKRHKKEKKSKRKYSDDESESQRDKDRDSRKRRKSNRDRKDRGRSDSSSEASREEGEV